MLDQDVLEVWIVETPSDDALGRAKDHALLPLQPYPVKVDIEQFNDKTMCAHRKQRLAVYTS